MPLVFGPKKPKKREKKKRERKKKKECKMGIHGLDDQNSLS